MEISASEGARYKPLDGLEVLAGDFADPCSDPNCCGRASGGGVEGPGYKLYRVMNRRDQKSYIGVTKRTVAERWSGHKCHPIKCKHLPLYRSLKRGDPDKKFLMYAIAETACKTKAYRAEKHLITKNSAWPDGYNVMESSTWRPFRKGPGAITKTLAEWEEYYKLRELAKEGKQ